MVNIVWRASAIWYRKTSRGLPSLRPMTQVPTIARPTILSPIVIGSGTTAATTSRGETSTPRTVTGSVRSRPMSCRNLSFSMKSAPRAYLKVTRLTPGIQRGTSSTSSCSTLTHSTGPISSGNGKSSGAEKGSVVCQSPSAQTTGGLRHSSMVVQMLNTGAKA